MLLTQSLIHGDPTTQACGVHLMWPSPPILHTGIHPTNGQRQFSGQTSITSSMGHPRCPSAGLFSTQPGSISVTVRPGEKQCASHSWPPTQQAGKPPTPFPTFLVFQSYFPAPIICFGHSLAPSQETLGVPSLFHAHYARRLDSDTYKCLTLRLRPLLRLPLALSALRSAPSIKMYPYADPWCAYTKRFL